MKFVRPIKFFQAISVAALIGLGAMSAKAIQLPPPTNAFAFKSPGIGNLSNTLTCVARSVNVIHLFVYEYYTNTVYWSIYFAGSTSGTWTNKSQIDQIIAIEITNLWHQIITNTDPTLVKSKGVFIIADVAINSAGGNYASQDAFWYYNPIGPVTNYDGSYSVPDLSQFSTILSDSIPFDVLVLQWARVEVGYDGQQYPFEVDDNLYQAGTSPVSLADEFVYLPAKYITNSASSGGNLWIKTSFVQTISIWTNHSSYITSNLFLIFNGDGNRIPETPMVLALNQHGTNATVTVNGGDSGRGFRLQSSATLTGWTNCGPVTFISPTNDLPGALPSRFAFPVTNRSLFYRAAMTNLPPQ